ncbi:MULTISPECIES: endonuclease/exonuclease/phosphatase family protein [Gordonia]|uniref:Endonuclease/exonuclease/phosphatase family protein n=1 Tax=Gordonia terrae TaxID=2055 RepID=A0A2I1RBG4_9ACTN|nr:MULTISPECIES: endonuclease/exonuclease/phosphatase family protein [Gordonia]MCG7632526.1 endonuclease/exonuclease/phosphatase family protein [Gordonia sp. McavH-238-E]PKZ66469.1 endonuclease/exonuclease/phosphatase family protein [Gordonia terrae]
MTRFLWAAAYVLGWAMLAGVVLGVFLHYYPSRGDVTLYLTSAVQFALIPGLIAIIVFGVLRRWFMLALAVVAAGALAYTQVPLVVAEAAPAGERFTVVSANLLFGGGDIAALEKIVADADPDLVSLQEVTPEALERLRRSEIGRALPHEFAIPYSYAAGTAMFSKMPLDERYNIPGTVLHNLQARTDLPGAAGTQVLAIHPAAPLWGRNWDWLADMDTLAAHFEQLPPGRVIAIGDYNSTWNHAKYRSLLTNGLVDGTDVAGAGFLPSYPTDKQIGNRPLVAIDRVILRGFVATSMDTHYLPGSDHRTLVVSLVAS